MDWDLSFQLISLALFSFALLGVRSGRLTLSVAFFGAPLLSLLLALIFSREIFRWMRLTSWVLFLHLPLFFLACSFLRQVGGRWRLLSRLSALLLIVVGLDAFFVEPHRLQITHYQVQVPKLKQALRLVVLSDIQTDQVGDYEEEVFRRAAEFDADLVLFPGDYLQFYGKGRAQEVENLRKLVASLRPRIGAWAVPGNVDPPDSHQIFRDTQVEYIPRMTRVRVNAEVELIGLSLDESFDQDLQLPASDLPLTIVLGHGPDFVLGSSDQSSFQLFIAGHTHGGQIQIPPFGPPLILSAIPRSWGQGALTSLSTKRSLVVSRGIGMERESAPRLRFFCPPEIVVIDVRPLTGTAD